MTEQVTTEQLLTGVAKRDESMLGQLYDRCAPKLFGMISEIVSDQEAAVGILRETFIRLWKDARRIDPSQTSAAVWLALEARARAADRRREDSGLEPLAHSRLQSLRKSAEWFPRAEEIAHVEKRRSLLEKIVRGLPGSQARLVELAIFKGSPETEIARELGLPTGQIQSELRAALRFLRHRLGAVLGTWTADI